MIFWKYGNQPVFCENVKSIKVQIQHVFPRKDQVKEIFFKTGEKFLIFHLLQRKRKLRMCGTETVDHRSKMVLGEKRKSSDMQDLGFTVLKMGHCFHRTMVLSGNFKCFFVKKLSCRSKHSCAFAAVPQGKFQFFFQFHDLFGKGGLGDMHGFRCIKKSPGLGCTDKIVDLFKSHDNTCLLINHSILETIIP